MSIVGRLIRRNILGKPLRSAAIIIALAASAFALLFCVEGREAPERELRNMMLRAYGGAEIVILDTNRDLQLSAGDFPEGTRLIVFGTSGGQFITAKGKYNITMRSVDPQEHKDFGFTDEALDPAGGAVISQKLAEKSGVKVGDTAAIEYNKNRVELKITKVTTDKYLRNYPDRILVPSETVKTLTGAEGSGCNMALADLPDELDVLKTVGELQRRYADREYTVYPVLSDEMLEEINDQTTVFYLIFAVILLMTLFLTTSMSRHIANERMSVIGTLRSLGGSLRKTSRILLIESAVYGIVGGALGAVGYSLAGDLAINAFFGGSTSQQFDMPLWMYPAAVAAAVLIQLICQSGALLRAVRTPVRDIIFSSRDTAYHISPAKVALGFVILGAGIAVGLITEEMIVTIAAVALICVGAVMSLPILLKLISSLLARLFGALGMPCAKLAAKELQHKKSTVTGTQLTFAALAITTAIFITVQSVARLYRADTYHFDARIETSLKEEESGLITDMPEITDVQFLYNTYLNGTIKDSKKHMFCVAGYDDYRLFTSIRGLGDEPAEGEAYIGRPIAEKYGLSAGDSFEFTDYDSFDISESGEKIYTPCKFKVKGICDTVDHFNETVVVNKAWFRREMSDRPMYIYVKLAGEGAFEAVQDRLADTRPNDSIISCEDMQAEDEENMSSIMTILYAITAVGCVLALLGAVSNAVIGFEQSKRKYAVLHSVAAGKRKLAKLILLETLLSSVISGVLALMTGMLLTSLIKNAMSNLGMGIEVIFNIPLTLGFIGGLMLVLMLAAVKPVVSLYRMNTAAELKYE